MALSEEFKKALQERNVAIENNNVLTIKEGRHTTEVLTSFDFLKRCMMVTFNKSIHHEQSFSSSGNGNGYAAIAGNVSITPFDQLDRDMLENMRQYLIDNNRSPLPLPEAEQKPGFGFDKDFSGGLK